ncbi:hypothetical protein DFH27DRAFT_251018 [Peziza echinospora]|nr:hypothetical protein DFH27DRAFT_251018 [Peziza echinospora]
MSFEPLRGSSPTRDSLDNYHGTTGHPRGIPAAAHNTPNPFHDPPGGSRQPQSYEDFRATGKSIELHDRDTFLGAGQGPRASGGIMAQIPGKKTWARVRLVLRILSLLCSVVTGGLIVAVLMIYMKTKNRRFRDEMLWPKDPMMVPTYYMLVAAIVTVLVHIGLIISHFYDKSKYYTEAYTKRDRISSYIQLVLFLTWIVGGFLARLYTRDKYGEGNDLWTWSCAQSWHRDWSGTGGQDGRGGGVHFGNVCEWLRAAYYTSYLNALLEFGSILTFTLNHCVARSKGYKGPMR